MAISLFSNPEEVITNVDVSCYETGYSILSGFSVTGVTGIFASGFQIQTTGITGYVNILSGFSYSGITGTQQNIIGSYVDNCGVVNNIYNTIFLSGLITGNLTISSGMTGLIFTTGTQNINLTGLITGESLISITGEVCVTGQESNLILDYYKDNNFLKSLSYSEVSLLKENIKTGDIVEVFTEIYTGITLNYNIDLEKNSVDQYYYNNNLYNSGEFILFKNGQALSNNNYNIIQSGYNVIYEPVFDYFVTGNKIYAKSFNDEDYVFIDNITGEISSFLLTGSTLNLPFNATINDKLFIFKNGQKLVSGRDYVTVTNNIFSLINTPLNQENYLTVKKYYKHFNYSSGESGSLKITGYYNNNSSQVYYNGIKQKLFNNYIENSKLDMISGNFYIKGFNDQILSDTDDFFINV